MGQQPIYMVLQTGHAEAVLVHRGTAFQEIAQNVDIAFRASSQIPYIHTYMHTYIHVYYTYCIHSCAALCEEVRP